MLRLGAHGGWLGIASLTLAAMLVAAPASAAVNAADAATDIAVKAAFLYNFARFGEWLLPAGATLILCVEGDDQVAAALVETVRGQQISSHALEVRRGQDSAHWNSCQLLFLADTSTGRLAGALDAVKKLPVMTVSDGKDFAQSGGIIELYVEAGRMRFAINLDAMESSGLRISSRLLGLAKVVRNRHGH